MEIIKRKEKKEILNLNGRQLILDGKSKIMGILNLTPDSFSDGGDFFDSQKALEQAKKMVAEGAHLLDLGAESSRAGHKIISPAEEIERLAPGLQMILEATTLPISIDTWKHQVADFALKQGASIINDIYGLQKDPKLAPLVAEHQAGLIIMHNKENNHYEGKMLDEMKEYFLKSLDLADKAGIDPKKIFLDPGIGFGKNPQQNIEVLRNLHFFKELGYPLLLAASRKSVIGSVVNLPAKERLPGTISTTVLGIMQGVEIFRVHDVAANLQAALFTDKIMEDESPGGQNG